MPVIDWNAVFVPHVSLLELMFRGSAMYLGIFFAMRFSRRIVGGISTADLLIVVLVADASQNAMSSQYHSVTEGAVLVGTIFAWSYILDWLEYRFPALRPLLQAKPLPLIRDGQLNRDNLRSEMITIAELRAQLREHGVEHFAQVKQCFIEADGQLSVVKAAGGDDDPHVEKRR